MNGLDQGVRLGTRKPDPACPPPGTCANPTAPGELPTTPSIMAASPVRPYHIAHPNHLSILSAIQSAIIEPFQRPRVPHVVFRA